MVSYSTNNNDDPIYATAVPFPDSTSPASIDRRSMLQRDQSSYSLPKDHGPKEINTSVLNLLKDQGFTTGLAKSLSTNNQVFPLRIWVVDNSGSMQNADGHRIIESKSRKDVKFSNCTRWAELKACIDYHVQMAALLKAPTTFRLLNDPGASVGAQQFSVAESSTSSADIMADTQNAQSVMNRARPSGVTPLIKHILEIQHAVTEMAPSLVSKGQRVAVIIATDGIPTDENGISNNSIREQFIGSLRLLEGLPVWVVIRLCTDEDDVVDFYNDLDEQLELSLEVLDDFVGEAKEVHAMNPWLNYALPLHRCREMGYYDRLFDLLDERLLTKGELREFCALLFGEMNFDGVPDPEEDWSGFMESIKRLVNMESNQWDPIKKKMCPWIDMAMLQFKYEGVACSCSIM